MPSQQFHITYREPSGAIRTGRVFVKPEAYESASKTRQRAIQAASWRFNIPTRRVMSAVAVSTPAETLDGAESAR